MSKFYMKIVFFQNVEKGHQNVISIEKNHRRNLMEKSSYDISTRRDLFESHMKYFI